MQLILFRSRLTAAAGDDYARAAAAMHAHARTFDGFIDQKSYTGADGERLTVVRWRDAASLAVWATDVRHRAVQATGRERWYEWYDMEVAELVRTSRFERPAGPATTAPHSA
jgi:heme-degrading monooxygenase HmoA